MKQSMLVGAAVLFAICFAISFGINIWQALQLAVYKTQDYLLQDVLVENTTAQDAPALDTMPRPMYCAEHIVIEEGTLNMTFEDLRFVNDTSGPKFLNDDSSLVVWVSGSDIKLLTEGARYDVEIHTWYHGYNCAFHFYNATAFVATAR